jgi:aspartyl/asparaginyl beta-hydroxylase (cupin superfamily)
MVDIYRQRAQTTLQKARRFVDGEAMTRRRERNLPMSQQLEQGGEYRWKQLDQNGDNRAVAAK